MNRFRKILALLLSFVLLLSLGGCYAYDRTETSGYYYITSTPAEKNKLMTIGYIAEGSPSTDLNRELGQLQLKFENDPDKTLGKRLVILHAPVGYTITHCYFMPHGISCYRFHPLSHPLSGTDDYQCDCQRGFEINIGMPENNSVEWLIAYKTPEDLLAISQVIASCEPLPTNYVIEGGSAILSPFYLPLIPFRLLRIFFWAIIKAAFAFGIGWLFVWFVKRIKKTPATE